MKRRIILSFIICCFILLTNHTIALSDTIYSINVFDGGGDSENALVNRGAAHAFASGDTLNFTNATTMTATSAIGQIGPSSSYTLTLNGNDKTISGNNSVSGFYGKIPSTPLTYYINDLNLNNFKNSGTGGAFYTYGTATITGSTFYQNSSGDSGGAIYSEATTLTISGSTFTENSSTGSTGAGAIMSDTSSTLILTDVDFYRNTATGGSVSGGGAVRMSGLGTVTNCLFDANIASRGGAVYVNSNNTITIEDSTFTSNQATDRGGAIYKGTNLTINNCTFGGTGVGNSAADGGAIYSSGWGSTMTISNSAFTGNNGTNSGGAIYNIYATAATTDSDFTNNSASTSGGAIYNAGTMGTSTSDPGINGGDFTYNYAGTSSVSGYGGAIYNTGTIYIKDATFSDNGKIYNSGSPITYTRFGGAIYNTGTMNISGGFFTSNATTILGGTTADTGFGGAIYNTGTLTISNGTTFKSNNSESSGGAIYNTASGVISSLSGTFGSATLSDGNTATVSGGAIYNAGTITALSGTFTNNSSARGGAIYNTGTITEIASGTKFETNSVSAHGGALYNYSGSITANGVTFDDNTATGNAGAIYNRTGANLTINNGTFTNNSAQWSGGILNVGTTSLTNTTFSNNSAYYCGALLNDAVGTLTVTGGSFSENTAQQLGGAVYNNGPATLTNVTFTENSITNGDGGAIYNGGDLTLSGGSFSGNTTASSSLEARGGAIFNYTGKTITINGGTTFTNNSASSPSNMALGGAIANFGTANITGATFTGNSVTSSSYYSGGGAIYNQTGTMTITNDSFSNNSAATTGGAIFNAGTLNIIDSNFTNNTAGTLGGAIYHYGGIITITANASDVTFSGNTQSGGAANDIYVDANYLDLDAKINRKITLGGGISGSSISSTVTKKGSGELVLSGDNSGYTQTFNQTEGTTTVSNKFFAGTSNVQGGILTFNENASLVGATLNSTGGTINFNNASLAGAQLTITGGTVNCYNQNLNTGNDIALNSGTMNLHSTVNGATYINDKIVGTSVSNSLINIITDGAAGEEEGKFYINNQISNSTISVIEGDLIIGNESYLSGNNMIFYGCNVNTQNSLIGNLNLGTLTFTVDCDPHWMLDVDLANNTADTLTATSVVPFGDKKITISNINLLNDATANSTIVNIANSIVRDYITNGVSTVNGTLYRYGVSYDSSTGNLSFVQNGFAPGAITSDVAQTQAFLLQTAIDRQFFANMESFMSFPLSTRESTICCALSNGSDYTGAACPISGNGTFSPIYQCDLNRGIWIKDFVSFENIPLRNGPNVSTIEYGTLIGLDAPLTYLKRGWVGNTSAYVGYLGSNQNYDGVGVSQNGGLVGLAENFVKGNNFLTLMGHVGSSMGIANTQYGNDYFNSIFAGGAAKGGHNFEYKDGEYIVQPNLMLAYTYTYTPTYNTAAGIEMTSRPLNAIQVAPGLRLIKNLIHDKGQVYLIGNFVYNIMDNTKFNANDVQLPELSIAPYIEYGIGYQRIWKERFTGFFQTLLRGGGRNGISLQFGLRWAF